MPTDVIDLGYHGTAYMAAVAPADNDGFNWGGTTVSCDSYYRDLHNRIKSQMEAENSGNNWSVGRIFRWQSATFPAYGWVVKHLDGAGVATGKEFLMVFGGGEIASTSLFRAKPNNVWELTPGSSPAEYMGSDFVSGGAETDQGFIGVHYHKGGLLGAGFTYDVGAGADFAAPTTAPNSNKAGFMPDTTGNPYPRGIVFTNFSTEATGQERICAVFNWEKPFIGVYRAWDRNHFLREISLVGDIIIPRLTSDTLTAGGLYYYPVNGAGDNGVYIRVAKVSFLDDLGNPLWGEADSGSGVAGLVHHQAFTFYNQPRADGSWDVDRIKVMARPGLNTIATYDKGYLDPDVSCVVSPARGHANDLFDSPSGKSLKVGEYVTVPWAAGYPIPFSGWPLNPQRVYKP